jgi:hypothetical protein
MIACIRILKADPVRRHMHTARILTVGLGGEVFAIPAGIVREILDVGRVTPVPDEVVSTDVPRIGTRWRPEFVVTIG